MLLLLDDFLPRAAFCLLQAMAWKAEFKDFVYDGQVFPDVAVVYERPWLADEPAAPAPFWAAIGAITHASVRPRQAAFRLHRLGWPDPPTWMHGDEHRGEYIAILHLNDGVPPDYGTVVQVPGMISAEFAYHANRLLIFPARWQHGRARRGGYGHAARNARLILVGFYDVQ